MLFDELKHLGMRREGMSAAFEPLTAELLRNLAAVQACGEVLLVAATNYLRSLDPPLLRPGRFDVMIPVGPPDEGGRAAPLERLLRRHRCGPVDTTVVARESDGRTRADLQAICDGAAAVAFEREIRSG